MFGVNGFIWCSLLQAWGEFLVVYHAMLNLTWQLFPINGSFYDPRITALIVTFVAVIVTVVWGPKTLAQYRYARSGQEVQASAAN